MFLISLELRLTNIVAKVQTVDAVGKHVMVCVLCSNCMARTSSPLHHPSLVCTLQSPGCYQVPDGHTCTRSDKEYSHNMAACSPAPPSIGLWL